MSKSTRIINKFEYWSSDDCRCEYCVHFIKDQPCPLAVCCIDDIRQEALRRERGVGAGVYVDIGTAPFGVFEVAGGANAPDSAGGGACGVD